MRLRGMNTNAVAAGPIHVRPRCMAGGQSQAQLVRAGYVQLHSTIAGSIGSGAQGQEVSVSAHIRWLSNQAISKAPMGLYQGCSDEGMSVNTSPIYDGSQITIFKYSTDCLSVDD